MNLASTLPPAQQRAYKEVLDQVQKILTNKNLTGLVDNNQSAIQDQIQSGQLSYIIIAITKLFHRLDELQILIENLERSMKNIQTMKFPTGTSSSAPPATIGTTFLAYNPPDK